MPREQHKRPARDPPKRGESPASPVACYFSAHGPAPCNDVADEAALYEPPLSIRGSAATGWIARYEREMGGERLAAAVVTALQGIDTEPLCRRLNPAAATFRAEPRPSRWAVVGRGRSAAITYCRSRGVVPPVNCSRACAMRSRCSARQRTKWRKAVMA